ncbi:MurR/RpiR family transcriptional regulator [Anaerosalibacter massiliensis]|uniref:MurR/RpiR family transcriptional regulator n=1 Tax=Anaerosalibacter massiliensis TaxID=1347392 RepID=A0A9X2MJX9_9FIRM|nr:MurR/RpiR family transcriptional regulator [Anaerosalibacter massiliensis]MCR2044425.1 MurR/RpiR family transcriptional regulator [Anaerosalibacter massiliensis]
MLLIESMKLEFTNVETVIAQHFLNRGESLTISELSQKLNVSEASITRFSSKLGFNNYKELIYVYNQELKIKSNNNIVSDNLMINGYMDIIRQVVEKVDIESIKNIANLICTHKIIHVFGLGLNGIVGSDLKFRLVRVGKYVEVVSDAKSMQMVASILEEDNLVLALTLRGKNLEMLESIKVAKKNGAKVVLITGSEDSPIIEYADYYVLTANLDHEDWVGSISAQIPMLIVIDMIFSEYILRDKDLVERWLDTEKAVFCK